MTELFCLSAGELAERYRHGTLDPVVALEAVLARLDEVNPSINALVEHDAAAARSAASASAARWRAGRPLSALDGVPFTVKDNIPVAGLRCTWGSERYRDYRPDRDETSIARLRAAGMVLLGKTNCPEFTLQGYTANRIYGVTRNPWNVNLTPGGSSGGAVAAVASGIGPVAIGTDGGGSLRRPAAHTGLFALKPSAGLIRRHHGLPAVLADFEVVGPISRTVEDAAQVLAIMSQDVAGTYQWTPEEPATSRPLQVAVLRRIGDAPVDPLIVESLEQTVSDLSRLGHQIIELTAGNPIEAMMREVNERVWPVIGQTALAWLAEHAGEGLAGAGAAIDPSLEAGLPAARSVSAVNYLDALESVRRMRERLAAGLPGCTVLLTPAAAAMPWPADLPFPSTIDGKSVGPRGHAIFTAFANAAGLPAMSVPGWRPAGALPIGMQFIGGPRTESMLLMLARSLERERPWHSNWPAVDRRAC